MTRANQRTWIVVAVIGLAALSVVAAATVYILNRPRRQKALFESAKTYVSQGDYAHAVLQFRTAVSLGNPSADLFYQYGLCLEKLHDARGASDAYQRAAACDLNHIESRRKLVGFYYGAARSALMQGQAQPQKDVLKLLQSCAEAMIRIEPDQAEGYLWLARCQSLNKQTDDALATVQRYLAKSPNDPEALAERVVILAGAQRIKEAQAEVGRALAQAPENATLLIAAAEIQRRSGDSAAEEQTLRKAVLVAPKDVRPLLQLATLLWRKGRFQEAERVMTQACEVAPDNASNWSALAQWRAELKQPAQAIQAILKAEAASPSNPEIQIQKIRLEITAENLVEARAGVENIGHLGNYPVYWAYAQALLAGAEEKPETAKTKFEEALFKSHDNFPEASLGLAGCQVADGDYGAAEKQLRLAARSPKFRQRAEIALAEMYLQESKPEEALAECVRVRDALRQEGGQDNAARMDLPLKLLTGRAHLAQGQTETAEAEFRAVAESADPAQKAAGLVWLARVELSRVRASHAAFSAEDRSRVDAARKDVQEAARITPADARTTPEGARQILLQAQLSRLLGDDQASAELERKASDSPLLAAQAIRLGIGAGPVREESAALARNLAKKYGSDVQVQSAAADFFGYAFSERKAFADTAAGADREAAQAAARSWLDAATQYARKALELGGESQSSAGRLFDFLRAGKQTAEARTLADGLAEKAGSKPLGLAFQGLLLFDEGKSDDAARQFEQSATLGPDDWRVQYWLGRTYARMKGQSEKAEAALGRALELSPGSTVVRAEFFLVLEAEGKLERLQAEIENALKESPGNVSLLALSARLFEKSGQPEQAQSRWRQITEMVPGSAEYQANYSLALVRDGKPAEAGPVARKALAINPKSLPALRALLLSQLGSGDRASAEETLRRAVADRPDEAALQGLAMDFYQSLGELSQAENELKKLEQSKPADPVTHYLLAEFYASQGRSEEALKEYGECLKLNAGFAPAILGAFHTLLGQAERAADPQQKESFISAARTKLADLQKSAPKSLAAAMAEVELFGAQRDYAQAEEKLKAVLRDFPDQSRPKVLFGRMLSEEGRNDEAIAYLRGVVEQDPRLVDAQLLLAQAAFEENRLRDAAESCQAALQYDPANVAVRSLLARIAFRKGDGVEGVEELRRVRALRPYDRVALYQLVQALSALGRDREAQQTAAEAFKNNPESPAFLEEYARCLIAGGKTADAEAVCRTFLAAHAHDETTELLLAQALFRQGKADEAGRVLGAWVGLAGSPESRLYEAMQVCQAAGANGPAASFARRLAEAVPDNPGVAKSLVQALNAAGQAQEAQQAAIEAARKHPDSAAFAQVAAAALNDAKQPDRAMEECAQFLARHPEAMGLQLVLAQLQIAAGRAGEAAASLKKVETADAKAPPQELELILRGYMQLKRYDEAAAVARRLTDALPNSAEEWLARAAVYEEQGGAGHEKAITIYREALSRPIRPQAVRAILENNLAFRLASKAVEHPSEADRLLPEAEALADTATGDRDTARTMLLDTLGWIKLLRNNAVEAAPLLETAAERGDASGEILYHYATACVRTGKLPLALEMASKAVERDPRHPEWLAEVKAEVAQSKLPQSKKN